MDVQMPVMDGFEATQQIRNIENIIFVKKTPIIAMTACAMQGDSEKCLQAGMNEYISKSINSVCDFRKAGDIPSNFIIFAFGQVLY